MRRRSVVVLPLVVVVAAMMIPSASLAAPDNGLIARGINVDTSLPPFYVEYDFMISEHARDGGWTRGNTSYEEPDGNVHDVRHTFNHAMCVHQEGNRVWAVGYLTRLKADPFWAHFDNEVWVLAIEDNRPAGATTGQPDRRGTYLANPEFGEMVCSDPRLFSELVPAWFEVISGDIWVRSTG